MGAPVDAVAVVNGLSYAAELLRRLGVIEGSIEIEVLDGAIVRAIAKLPRASARRHVRDLAGGVVTDCLADATTADGRIALRVSYRRAATAEERNVYLAHAVERAGILGTFLAGLVGVELLAA